MSFVDALILVLIMVALIGLFVGTIYAFVERYWLCAAAGVILLVVAFAAIISAAVGAGDNAPCSDFANTTVRNVPARCAAEFGITR